MSVAEEDDYFIQQAIKHPGSLRKFAKQHRAMNEDGTINMQKVKEAAGKEREPGRSHRLKQINLARTLRKLRR